MLLWFAVSVGLLLVMHGRTLLALWREPVLSHPVVIVESDDWGPGPASDAAMLRQLVDRLGAIRDAVGHPAVMTLGIVSGQPDGPAIMSSGLSRYYRRTLGEPEFAQIVDAIRTGCDEGVFALQRHGLEHCWPSSLLRQARKDEALQRWLSDPEARSEALPPPLQSRWVDASVLPSQFLPEAEIRAAIDEEAVLLQQVFGQAPSVAVPNTFVWNDDVERAWAASGVTCIVTPGRRLEGRNASGGLQPAICRIRNGERTASGATQIVRDDYFEPIRGHRAEDVWRAVYAKRLLGRPSLLETHRESFVASPEVSDFALSELQRALEGVRERWPDVRFMSTIELARQLADPGSPLKVRAAAVRFEPYLQRILCEGELQRLLKFSGLRILVALMVRVSRRVKNGRYAVMAS